MKARAAKARYKKLQVLGRGAYGVVYKAEDTQSGRLVALKKQYFDEADGLPQHVRREVTALKRLRHAHIVELLEVVRLRDKAWLVLELLDDDLGGYIESLGGPLAADLAQSYLYQLLSGLAHCHAQGWLHRDLKPQNLLIDAHGTLKMADFGLARRAAAGRRLTGEVETRYYRAPELLLGAKCYGAAIDVWAVGCILAEMLTGAVLFRGDCDIGQFYCIFRQLGTPDEARWPGLAQLPYYQAFPQWAPRELPLPPSTVARDAAASLLATLLTYDPAQRITANAALRHTYLAEAAALWTDDK